MFANCSLSGMDFGMPDVCLTPAPPSPVPIPIPYPNTAQLPMALPPTTSLKHLISMMPALKHEKRCIAEGILKIKNLICSVGGHHV